MRFVQLIFSPTGGVKRAAGLLSAPMADQPDIIDLSLPLNGTPRFSPEDVCLIAVPCFGGRVPEIALERLAQTQARMAAAVERQLSLSRQRLEALAGKRVLQSPMNYLQDKRMTLEYSRERLSSASQRLMQAKREQFVRLTAKLDAMSPLKVLSRGYSVVRTEDGSVLRRAADARPGDRIQIDLMQGTLLAEVSQVLEAEDA